MTLQAGEVRRQQECPDFTKVVRERMKALIVDGRPLGQYEVDAPIDKKSRAASERCSGLRSL